MKSHNTVIITALALAGAAFTLTAQDAGGPPPGDRPPLHQHGPGGPGGPGGQGGPGGPGLDGHRPPPPPLIAALDANGDGVIDEQEIANASAALRKLDKNGDGKLTMDELRPPRPDGQASPGGPGGQHFRPPHGGQQGGNEGQPPRPPRPPAEQ